MQETILHIKNLNKQFAATTALKGINLSVKKGEIFGIIGMSGAGKSTLVRSLCCLEKPTSGQVCLQGVDLSALQSKELRVHRKKMGMIFQHFNLFSSRNVIENVVYPLEIEGISKKERMMRAEKMLRIVGLSHKANCYPTELSGGEKQRVAIGRALVHEPILLLCDEATSALDPQTTQSILDLLSELNLRLNLTIVLITHEMEVVKRICTQVAVLEKGEVIEQGGTLDLLSSPQHPTTKRFLQSPYFPMSHFKPGSVMWHLSFKGTSAEEPLISQVIKRFAIILNIVMGNIDVLKGGTLGNLVVAVEGEYQERLHAMQFLQAHGVIIEEIHS